MYTDLISDLPDEVLGKILSLIPTKLAASTSVLYKRWRNLLRLVDNFDFDESMLFYPDKIEEATSRDSRFSDFVDKTLALSSLIKKFSLICLDHDESHVNRWIRTALEHGCLELYLETEGFLGIDTEFFTSDTLVKLTITDGFYYPNGRLPPKGLFFPALKTLTLDSVSFVTLEMFNLFIHGCPSLEELFMFGWKGYLSSPCLKRVTITSVVDRGFNLNTPSLVYLDYSCYVANDYKVSLDSLLEARLNLRLDEAKIYYDDGPSRIQNYGNVTSLIQGMSNIKTLHLSPSSLEVFYFCCDSMLVLNNLVSLFIESDKEKGWQVMPRLLNNSPNLQTLVIKGLVHRVTDRCGDVCACVPMKKSGIVFCLSKCRVKVLEISGYGGSLGEVKQMRHFLGKLECLETVKVDVKEDNNNSTDDLRANLMALPRVSSKCKILFI